MWFTKRIWNFIQNTFETIGGTLDTLNSRLTATEKDLVQYHNEHEEEIRVLKRENKELRSDLDQLCNVLSIGYRVEEAQPARPERRIFVKT